MSEHLIQKAIVDYLNRLHILAIETDVMDSLKFLDSQNRRFAFINYHKAMGYVKGQPDLILFLPKRIVCVELKSDKGKQSKEQKDFEAKLKTLGLEYYIWRSVDDAKNFVDTMKQKK